MTNKELLTIQEFAMAAGKKPQTIYKQLNNRLKPYVQLVDKQKMLKSSALKEIYNITVEQPNQPELNNSFNSDRDKEILFLRSQVELLQQELQLERQHNREKDKQLLDTLTALAAGQTADKQKALATTLIEGQQLISNPSGTTTEENKKPGLLTRLFKNK